MMGRKFGLKEKLQLQIILFEFGHKSLIGDE